MIISTVRAIEDHDTISITTFAEKNNACVHIRHTGVGIPPEYLQENFNPGFPTKDVGVGTGLDLSICYQIFATYCGDILEESEVGKITNFMAVLPMQLKERDYRA